MKKILSLLICFNIIFIFNISYAFDIWKCYYPKTLKITDSEFSTGGGDKIMVILEVSGIDKNTNQYVKYIDTLTSITGLLGLSRFTCPDKIEFIPWNKNYIEFDN